MNGERTPTEVYQDFRSAVLDILNQQENQEAMLNGVSGIGHGTDDIPGSIVSVDTAPSKEDVPKPTEPNPKPHSLMNGGPGYHGPETFRSGRVPQIIWVIGGPGSNKATLCLKAVGINPGWGHIRWVKCTISVLVGAKLIFIIYFHILVLEDC